MRKILLGTTAVVSAAFGAAVITPAAAQNAPTVRIGGALQVYYGYINQNGASSNPANTPGVVFNNTPLTGTSGATTVLTSSANPGPGVAAAGANLGSGGNFARLGKNDIIAIPTISILVDGKAAQGFTYGANVTLSFNGNEGDVAVSNRVGGDRGTAALDEAYLYFADPRLGQIRAGDEDGVLGGLMNSGFITNAGTGGVYGVWENFQTRQTGNRTQTGPGQIGDNTKIIYMSPQFFGFDFGVSYAPNGGGFGQSGCPSDSATSGCDRAYAFRGATSWAVAPAQAGGALARRNEYQVAARYRGSFAGVGVAATVGYIGTGVARDLTEAGLQVRTLSGLSVWQFGAQASYMGLTVGASYQFGDYNFFWGNPLRGDRSGESLNLGASYTAGPITIGTNFVSNLWEGGSRESFNQLATNPNNALTRAALPTAASNPNTGVGNNFARERRWGFSLGGNYRLAPGLDLIAEYVYHSRREQGRDFDAARQGVQSRAQANVFILGSRLVF